MHTAFACPSRKTNALFFCRGPFQPSHTLALKFYGLYKQGTEGPCDIPKPAFWQMIAKAKYDAWKTVGKMTKEEAKRTYIEELKKVSACSELRTDDRFACSIIYVQIIEQNSGSFSVEQIIETMSFNSDVASFTELLGAFYEFVPEEMRERMVSAIAEQDEDASVSDSGVDVRSPTERELANALGQYMDSSSLCELNATTPDYLGRRAGAWICHFNLQLTRTKMQ